MQQSQLQVEWICIVHPFNDTPDTCHQETPAGSTDFANKIHSTMHEMPSAKIDNTNATRFYFFTFQRKVLPLLKKLWK
jgi:hypothetical protein